MNIFNNPSSTVLLIWWTLLGWENDCKHCGKLLWLERHSVNHDMTDHGPFWKLFMKKAMEDTDIFTGPLLTGLYIHGWKSRFTTLTWNMFLRHQMACMGLPNELSLYAHKDLWMSNIMWNLWKIIRQRNKLKWPKKRGIIPQKRTFLDRHIRMLINMTMRKWVIPVMLRT